MTTVIKCKRCKKAFVRSAGEMCHACQYADHVEFMLELDEEDQDWEFAHCEECGSSLDDKGDCPNTWCGNSPHQGEDWL